MLDHIAAAAFLGQSIFFCHEAVFAREIMYAMGIDACDSHLSGILSALFCLQ